MGAVHKYEGLGFFEAGKGGMVWAPANRKLGVPGEPPYASLSAEALT